jgi:PhzF family phenazine biosynthesis protein
MKINIFQVDSFTDDMFEGYTSSVCALPTSISDELMQKIAAETNLSKTAFVTKLDHTKYEVRWFTPTTEVTLSDHASLASAYVIFNHLNTNLTKIVLKSLGGDMVIEKDGDLFSLNFPSKMPSLYEENNPIFDLAIGSEPLKVLSNLDYILVYDNEEIVKNINPKIDIFKSLDLRGVCVTARGSDNDFVFKYFAPKLDIDPGIVTGSVCSQLAPYWSKVLGKETLTAHQLSSRKSDIICDINDDFVSIKGKAKLFMKGEIIIEQRSAHRSLNEPHSKLAIAI